VIGISITPEDVQKTRGLSGRLDDLTLEVSPHGGHLVAVAQYQGCNVCWACCEPFAPEGPERMIECRPTGGGPDTAPVGLHAKCRDPKARKVFWDMGGDTRLQSVEEVGRGLRLRRLVSKVVKPLAEVAGAAKNLIVGE
jgi:hypothetical protein